MKTTIIYTTKEQFGIRCNGWLTEYKMEQIANNMGFGLLLDYIHCKQGDIISHPYKKRLNKSNTNLK